MKSKFLLFALALSLSAAFTANAQLAWSSYNTGGTRVSASAATYNSGTNSYTFTIPASTTHTFVTTNFVPVGLAASQTKTVAFTMNASGGFGAAGTPIINQRFIACGLFNYGATAPGATGQFTDDLGLWTDSYQQTSGIAPSVFGGTSTAANLLAYQSTRALGAVTGPPSGAAGQFVDGSTTNVTFRVVENGSGVATIGTGSTTATAGAWYADAATTGTTFNRTIYSGSATTPSGTTSFNEFGFLFNNTTASAVTLTLGSFTGLTPIFTAQPPTTTVTTAGSNVTIAAAAPTATAFQWQKSTDGGTTFSNVSGATSATLTLTSVQAGDGAIYRVVATTLDGSYTSTNATLTVVTTAANGTAGLNWSSYDTSGNRVSTSAATYDNSTGTYTFTIPASTTYTFVTTNFAPLTLAASQTQTVTYTMTASGGFGPAGTPVQNQRFIAYGLFNYGATAPGATGQFTDDVGLWTDSYQQSSGIAPSVFGGTSTAANLLAYQSTRALGAASGPSSGAVGQFTNGSATNVTFRVVENSGGTASIGTGTATSVAGAWYQDAATSGTTLNRTIYSGSATTPSGTTTFNEFAFMFYNSTASSVTLTLKNITGVTPPPFITAQPPTTSAGTTNGSVSLAVTATTSAGTLSYQWQKSTDNGVTFNNIDPYSGNATAGTATLTLSNLQLSDAGIFRVLVTNAAGTVISNNSTLTVTAGVTAPSITTQPSSSTVLVGAAASFSVVASGTTPLTYQWRKSTDGTTYNDISGSTSATYSIATAALTDTGYYKVVVTNSAGSATSNAAILTVNQMPSISVQPVGATLNVGASLTLSVTATGTPAPTYQWTKNGVNITGATSSTYPVASVTGADTANYAVVVTNSVSSVTSNAAAVAVLSATLAPTALAPGNAATGRNPDTRLAITFNAAVTPGVSGFLRIYDASNDSVVDTIDFATATTLRNTLRATSTLSTLNLPVQNKSIGGTTNFNYYPITISGNTATIYPRNGVLAYGKTYYVKIDAGAFVNAAGESFAGISNTTTWSFSTKASGPTTGATALTVAAAGTGDFDTVQGAIDWVPSTNAAPLTITIKNGTYFEEVVFTNKNYLRLIGEDRAQTTIVYPNNNNFNNVGGGIYHRATFIGSGIHDITVANLKFVNTTPQNGSQAEAFILNGSATFTARNLVTKCSFYSYQDTIQLSRQCYVSDSYIEGDVDFMWGGGPAFFSNCDIKVLRSNSFFCQVRNDSSSHGFVYSNCRFTTGAGFTGNYLNRIDPTGSPYCEVVLLNSTIGDATNNASLNTSVAASGSDFKAGWWLLNGTTSGTTLTANVHNWDYNTVDGTGAALTFSNRPAFTIMPTDATTLANFGSAFWVLNTTWAGVSTGTWTPSLAPIFLTQPQSQSSVVLGASVTFTAEVAAVPTATYQWYRNGTAISGATGSSYTIASPALSDAGNYLVVATNPSGATTSNTAVLTVTDNTPPVITSISPNLVREATSAAGANVTYAAAAATDNSGVAPVITYSQASGTIFPIGTTTVTVTATDGSGNASTGTFTVTVRDTTAPVVTPPSNITVAATSSSGATVSYSSASASDAVGVVSFSYSPASGTVFPIGTTTVTATARDAANNAGTGSFTVTVTPLTPVQSWREQYFGTTANTGNAADSADADGDGITNVMEFAFGTDPTNGASGPAALQYSGTFGGGGSIALVGQPVTMFESAGSGIDFRALFVRRANYATVGLTYTVEFSADLTTWAASSTTPTALATDGTLQIVSVPYVLFVGGKKARFFRVRVMLAP